MDRIGARRWFAWLFIATVTVAFCCPGVAHAADGHITGTVTAAVGGAPIEGIQVVPCVENPPGSDMWEEMWPGVQTDASGLYDLALAPGLYRLRFWDPTGTYGYQYWPNATAVWGGELIEVAYDVTVSDIDQSLPLAAKITGAVTADVGSAPLPDIQVVAHVQFGGGWSGVVDATTDASGYYELRGLPPGTFKVSFSDPAHAYASESYDNVAPWRWDLAQPFTLGAGDDVGPVNAALAVASSISGTITGSGAPLATGGVFLAAEQDGWWSWVDQQPTDSSGAYALLGLPAGTYRLQFYDMSGTYMAECWENKPGDLALGDNIVLDLGADLVFDADLALASHITGTVLDETDDDLGGIRVTVYTYEDWGDGTGWWSERGEWQDWTEEDGTYDIGGLPPGAYRLGFHDDDGYWATEFYADKTAANWADNIELGDAETFVANAVLVPGAQFSGRVTSDGVNGIEGITVAAGPFDFGLDIYEHVAWAQTDADGYYTIVGLPAGDHIVQFMDDSGTYLSECYDDVTDWHEANPITLAVGEIYGPSVDAVLGQASHITGTITDGADPIANIRVSVYTYEDWGDGSGWWSEAWDWQAWTDENGTYDIGGLPPGTYRLGFHDDGGYWATEFYAEKTAANWADNIELGAGQTAIADAVLEPGAQISGRVTSDGVNGIAGITVAAGPFDFGLDIYEHIAWVQTDEDGYYTLTGLPAGDFIVQFWDDWGYYLGETYDDKQDWHEADPVYTSAVDPATSVDAELAPAASISGTVSGDGVDALQNIDVQVFEDYGEGWWEWVGGAQTDNIGAYRVGGLWGSDAYRVWFTDWTGTWASQAYLDESSFLWGDDVSAWPGSPAEGIDVTLEPGCTIQGTVYGGTGTGNPLANAGVAVGPWDEATGQWDGWWGYSEVHPDGTYIIRGLKPGSAHRLYAWDMDGAYAGLYWESAASVELANDVYPDTGGPITADFHLPVAAHISGTVTDSSGTPLEGIAAFLFYENPESGFEDFWASFGGQQAQTDADGNYDIGGLLPGNYRVGFIDYTGVYGTEFWDDAAVLALGDTITIDEYGQVVTGKNAALSLSGTIEGTVTDTLGNPLQGVRVSAAIKRGDGWWESYDGWGTETDANGHYVISAGLRPEDELFVRAESWDGTWVEEWWQEAASFDDATSIHVTAGSSLTGIDFTLDPAGFIAGTITLENPSDGYTGIGVALWQPTGLGDEWHWVGGLMGEVSESGEWAIGGLAPGEYFVQFYDERELYAAEYYDDAIIHADATPVTVVAGETAVADAYLEYAGYITGSVMRGGFGIQGIGVRALLWDSASMQWVTAGGWTVETDADGLYSLPIRTGIYRVEFSDPTSTYVTQYFDGAPTAGLGDDVQVLSGFETVGVDADLTLPASLTVNAKNASDEPLEGIGVELYYRIGGTWQSIASGSTDPAGAWFVENLLPGFYAVYFDDPSDLYVDCYYDSKSDLDSADMIEIAEDESQTITQVMTSTVTNTPPVLDPIGDKTVNELALLTFTATATDADLPPQTLTFTLGAGAPTGASITEGGVFTWTPTEAQGPGTYPITVVVSDGAETDSETITVTVDEVNSAPVLDPIGDKTVNELALLTFTATATDADLPPQTLTFTLGAGAPTGASITEGGIFTWTPSEAQGPGTYEITVVVSDGAETDSETITVTVNEVAGAPTAVDDSYETNEDEVLVVDAPGVLGNDTDPEGDDLTAVLVADVAHGTLDLAADGSFTYTPDPDFSGTDTFTYRASDGVLDSNTATVTITVTPVNDAPVAVDDSFATPYNTVLPVAAPGVLANDEDVDGDELSAIKVTGPAHGTLALNADGSFTYAPTTGFYGQDTFTYKANDGMVDSEAATVTITVLPPASDIFVPIFGANRFATAVEISRKAFPSGADYVVIATGENWPDALGGASLAGALDGPILLSRQGSLPAEVAAEISRLGARKAVILGSTASISTAVEGALKAALGTGNVVRIGGADRYETARMIAREAVRLLKLAGRWDGNAFVATGANFPDALGASPLAAAKGWPIFLINPRAGADAATVASMKAAGVTKAVVLGDRRAVSETAKNGIGAGVPCATQRLAGANRYDTAVAVAAYGVTSAGLSWNRLALATGTNFPDALAGGVLQGKDGSVLLLTPGTSLNATVEATLAANKATIHEVRFLGDTRAISAGVRTAVANALR